MSSRLLKFSVTLPLLCSLSCGEMVFNANIHVLDTQNLSDPYGIDFKPLYENLTENTVDNKIINGVEAGKFAFPYQAAIHILNDEKGLFCGGSIISSQYILTAAHCFERFTPDRIVVILGNEHLRAKNNFEKRIDVDRYLVHSKYNHGKLKNDICLLHLETPAKFNRAVSPIALPRYRDVRQNYLKKIGVVSGFGNTRDGGKVVNDLRYTRVEVMDNLICNKVFNDNNWGHTNICTTGKYHKGPCFGDSGGPLVINKILVGVVSYGGKFCTVGLPIVYTRVPKYLNWIAKNTNIIIEE